MIEKFLNGILSQLGAGSRESVYISVTPGVGLEMIQIDPVLKSVKAYGQKPLEYSDSMREITNYDDFKAGVQELFTELGLNTKCNVIVSIPTVHLGKIELPILLNDEGVLGAITSEVEQAYLFKRCEPVISWFEGTPTSSENRTIFYSAIQKTAVDKIRESLTELGANLAGVQISLVSTLRALAYSGLTSVQMEDNTSWNLMMVNSTGYSIIAMSGKNIVDIYEEPLALKTYGPEEIYDVINASVQLSLMNFPTNYLYIVSNTDMVSAELLASKLSVEGKIDFLENNSFKKQEILPVSLDILPDLVKKISLDAVGIATVKNLNYPVNIDFVGNNEVENKEEDTTLYLNFKGKEIILTEAAKKKIAMVLAAIIIAPALITMLTLPKSKDAAQAKLDDINSQIKKVEEDIKKLSNDSTNASFDVKVEIENVLKNNRAKLMSYSSLGESVPSDLWITYFSAKDDGKINIKGLSENVEDIYLFFRNMKDSLIGCQLRLRKLEMQANSIDDAVYSTSSNLYEFEVTNMSEEELGAAPADEQAESQSDAKSKDTKSKSKDDTKKAPSKKVNDLEPVDVQ